MKLYENKVRVSAMLTIAALFAFPIKAQVNIGSLDKPQSFSILELTTTKDNHGGLRMPQLNNNELNTLTEEKLATPEDKEAAEGLCIYNIETDCLEFWNGTTWISLCANQQGDTSPIDASVLIALSPGTGCFSGKACFDITRTDNTGDTEPGRGALSWRNTMPAKTDFRNGVSETYTFSPIGTVSNVRFGFIENAAGKGKIVQSLTPANPSYATGKNISTGCTVTLTYKPSLYNDAYGTTQANALKVDIYAVYNNLADGTGEDATVKLTATIKDGACCGAKAITSNNSCDWLQFMCFNLGANESLNPLTPNSGLYGDKYKWGTGIVALTAAEDAAYTGTISDWATRGGTPPATSEDWDMTNRPPNPCPPGWRVPAIEQWQSIYELWQSIYNAPGSNWILTGNDGYAVGDALFLPAAGRRNNTDGGKASISPYAAYWSTTFNGSGACPMNFTNTGIWMGKSIATSDRSFGNSVRCVAE